MRNKLHVLCVYHVYNEMSWLPIQLNWVRNNGFDIYVVDHTSTDGTQEWLKSNSIPHHKYDNGGSFHLGELHEECMKAIRKIAPDWVIYGDPDSFLVTEKPLIDEIIEADEHGVSGLLASVLGVYNTGEDKTNNPIHTYFWGNIEFRRRIKVAKYTNGFGYDGDCFVLDSAAKTKVMSGYLINYGGIKPIETRKEYLERHKKAWSQGMNKLYGTHLIPMIERNGLYSKDSLFSFRREDFLPSLVKYTLKENQFVNYDSKKFTIIIPTMFVNPDALKIMLHKYEASDFVEEIIVVNNGGTNIIPANRPKVRVINDGKNIYVNPAWNLGVSEAKTRNIILANDDIVFDNVDSVLSLIFLTLRPFVIIGIGECCYPQRKYVPQPLRIIKSDNINWGFGTFMAFTRESYVEIPDKYKIWVGDNILHDTNYAMEIRGLKVVTDMSETINSSSELKDIARKELAVYRGVDYKEERPKKEKKIPKYIILREERKAKLEQIKERRRIAAKQNIHKKRK